MGSKETDKASNEAKEGKEPRTPTSQEQSSAKVAVPVNQEWSGFQAYSPMPPHGFLASSPQAHPYMWGVQHLMSPYGTPPHPYVAMYTHGGVYAHPSIPPGSYPFSPFAMPSPNGIAEASINTPGNMEVDGKQSEGKEKLPNKRCKGSLGSLKMISGKNNEPGKTSGASDNGASSKSTESGSEGSSAGSDANSQSESQMKEDAAVASQNGSAALVSQNGPTTPHSMVSQSMAMVPMPATVAPGGTPGPATNLNIGMDYWGTATSSAVPAICGKVPTAPLAGAVATTGSRDSFQSQIWDERELKRQRRKQSNRESARRSRLRRQAECDELSQCAESLNEENASLKAEVSHLRSEYERLLAENASLKERLEEVRRRESFRSSGNDHRGNDTQHSGQE